MSVSDLPIREYEQGDFSISTNPARIDLDAVHAFLSSSYWAENIPRKLVERSIANSLSFGLYKGREQVGFAHVISDFATYAYVADVYVLESYRGRGLSKWLMKCIVEYPALQGLRRWTLATRDAHGLYAKFGFTSLSAPDRWMERRNPSVYPAKAEAPRTGE
jgi:GNAT superfamily N-acetyltransferase